MVDGIIDRLVSISAYHNHADVRSIDDSFEDSTYDLTGILRKRIPVECTRTTMRGPSPIPTSRSSMVRFMMK